MMYLSRQIFKHDVDTEGGVMTLANLPLLVNREDQPTAR